MYYYKYFCYCIETNMPCRFLLEIDAWDSAKYKPLKINLVKERQAVTKTPNGSFQYRQTNEAFWGKYNDLSFQIVWRSMTIFASAWDIENAFLTLLNVPAALLIASDGNLVLHCSTVLKDDKLFSFFGPKGVGKTTKSMSVLRDNKASELYSDDSLCVNFESRMVFSNYYVFKLTDYTKKWMPYIKKDTDCLCYKNGKSIYRLSYNGSAIPLANLECCFLFRSAENKEIPIDAPIFTYLLKQSIIGINYMRPSTIKEIDKRINIIVGEARTSAKVLFIANDCTRLLSQ